MHKAEGEALGLDYEYRLIDTCRFSGRGPQLNELLDAFESGGFVGLNITHPFKRSAMEWVDEVSKNASVVGAINTIVFRNGRRYGHNTDCWGFEQAFCREMASSPRGSVLLIGAGGAGGAVAKALLDQGVEKLLISDTNAASAAALADRMARYAEPDRIDRAPDLVAAAKIVDGIVNATPLGMAGHPGCPIEPLLLRPDHWVADVVYLPLETELLRRAREVGCAIMSGSGMAIFQAVRAFELFTGCEADAGRMRSTFNGFSGPDTKAENGSRPNHGRET